MNCMYEELLNFDLKNKVYHPVEDRGNSFRGFFMHFLTWALQPNEWTSQYYKEKKKTTLFYDLFKE